MFSRIRFSLLRKAAKFGKQHVVQRQRLNKRLLSWPPLLYLVVFFLVPTTIMFIAALRYPGEYGGLAPLYTSQAGHTVWHFTIENFQYFFAEPLYWKLFLTSFYTAALTTLLCIILAYPLSWFIARSSKKYRNLLLLLVILPFWSSFLVRVYAWVIILGPQSGFSHAINWILQQMGFEPIQIMFSSFAVMFAMVYVHLPFMILPLYANLEKHDMALLDAAQDLGANSYQRFWRITFPLSLPGIFAGAILVFVPALGMFAIPDILGGTQSMMIGNLIKQQILETRDWPFGSTLSIMLTLSVLTVTALSMAIANWQRLRTQIYQFGARYIQHAISKKV